MIINKIFLKINISKCRNKTNQKIIKMNKFKMIDSKIKASISIMINKIKSHLTKNVINNLIKIIIINKTNQMIIHKIKIIRPIKMIRVIVLGVEKVIKVSQIMKLRIHGMLMKIFKNIILNKLNLMMKIIGVMIKLI